MQFNPGFNIEPNDDPLGFSYGKNTFGPVVENRTLEAIRKNLMDPNCEGPEIVYAIAMDVGDNRDKKTIIERDLLYGTVTYAKGQLGNEPIRSQGHIHAVSKSCGMSTCEVYEIWSGSAYIYMQETVKDRPGRCYAVFATQGEVVIVPPSWAHCTIAADTNKNLTFGAWCVRDFGFDYNDVRKHKGLAWYPVVQDGRVEFVKNKNYDTKECIVKRPRIYKEFGIEQGKAIYTQFVENPDKFLFVSKPQTVMNLWEHFIP